MEEIIYKVTFIRDEFEEFTIVSVTSDVSLDAVLILAMDKFRDSLPSCYFDLASEYHFKSLEVL